MNRAKAIKYFNQGVEYFEKGQFDLALECYTQAIKENPKYVVAYSNRGFIYHQLKLYKQAIRNYEQAIKLNPKFIVAYYNRASIYIELKQYEQALKDYDQAIKLNSKDAISYYNRGNIYCQLKQYEQALKDYDQAIKLNPKYTEAYNNRGIVYSKLKQYENAKDDWKKCIELTEKKEEKKSFSSLCYSVFLAEQQFELAEYYAHKIFEFSENIEEFHKKTYLDNIEKAKEIYQKNQELENAYLLLKEDYKAEIEEKKRFEEMSIMATGVAHEINQPVGVIQAKTSAAQTDLKDNLFSVETELHPLLETILSQTKRLEHIINNFRAFSRGDHSKCEIVDVNKLVDQTVSVLNSQLSSIQIIIERNPHAKVWANFFALERAFINLLKNAKEALENREYPTIWIKINQQNQNVIIIIEDNGCGVDPEFESKLFTPFISTKSTSKGTGLGLNLSRRLIEEFNGQLTYQPTKEVGASFKITLPLFREENHHG